MNSKERILATLNREPIDRIAVDLWHTPEVGRLLREYFRVDSDLDLYKTMKLDKIVWAFLDYEAQSGEIEGAQAGAGAEGTRTMWGVPMKTVQVDRESYHEFVDPPMTSYDDPNRVDLYPFWPDPERFNYDSAAERAKVASQDFAVVGPWVSFFEIYCQLRGLEQAMIDLALHPALVEAILDRIEEIQTEMMKKFFRRAGQYLDLVFVSDDIACQRSLLFSPSLWRRHLMPRLVRWCDLIHSHGLRVFYHTDGAAEPLIEALIDCGIDVLNPIQHRCPGMEPVELKRKHGDRVILHGGVDNQSVLPFGSVDDVRREVRHLLDMLGSDSKGYICSSCHSVQANTPLRNVLAMVETVIGHGNTARFTISELPRKSSLGRDTSTQRSPGSTGS